MFSVTGNNESELFLKLSEKLKMDKDIKVVQIRDINFNIYSAGALEDYKSLEKIIFKKIKSNYIIYIPSVLNVFL